MNKKQYTDPDWDEISKMTAEELRADLVAQGLDPDAEIAAMRRLGRVLAAQFAPQIERESRLPPDFCKPFPLFAEVVAAGSAAWAEAPSPSEEGSLLDVLANASKDDTILARVRGWSMRDAGISDGDLLMVNTKQEAKDGDIVLAHLAGEGQVVKRLRIEVSRVLLVSANPDFEPIVVEDSASLRIHGVVVGRAGKV